MHYQQTLTLPHTLFREILASSSRNSRPEQFKPPRNYHFPKRKFGKGNDQRSFRTDWCDSYGWLHYDAEKDTLFCYLCIKMEQEGKFVVSRKRDPTFISKSFTYWKEATTAFKKHQESECHLEAS